MQQRHYNIPVFIPNAACPNQCIFCSQKKISGAVSSPSIEEMKHTIDLHLSTIPENSKTEIAFFGGTFTGLALEEQKKYLQAAQEYIKEGSVKGIRLSTRPDCITKEILSLLKKFNVTAIELGAQSMDDKVLELSARGHSSNDVLTASGLIKKTGISLGLQIMIGLPGDTLEKATATAQKIASISPETVRIYPTLVIKGTDLEKLYLENKYSPLTLKEAVEWSAVIMHIFEEQKINVIRVGLHPSEGLMSGESMAAGPFHQSFRELVLTEIWRKQVEPLLLVKEKDKLIIRINPQEYNYAIGYRASNKKMLLSKYGTVIFEKDESIKKGREYIAIYN